MTGSADPIALDTAAVTGCHVRSSSGADRKPGAGRSWPTDGYQLFATNTGTGQLAFLDARHRTHARVQDRIRASQDTYLVRILTEVDA